MSNLPVNRTYNETMRQLEIKDPAHASTFNPLFNQLLNNDANLHDGVQRNVMFPSSYPINLDGMTVGNIVLVSNPVILGTINLA